MLGLALKWLRERDEETETQRHRYFFTDDDE
jgi:hypothetical protein